MNRLEDWRARGEAGRTQGEGLSESDLQRRAALEEECFPSSAMAVEESVAEDGRVLAGSGSESDEDGFAQWMAERARALKVDSGPETQSSRFGANSAEGCDGHVTDYDESDSRGDDWMREHWGKPGCDLLIKPRPCLSESDSVEYREEVAAKDTGADAHGHGGGAGQARVSLLWEKALDFARMLACVRRLMKTRLFVFPSVLDWRAYANCVYVLQGGGKRGRTGL